MLILVGASVASWATIFRKSQTLKRVRKLNDDFEQDFWSGTSLNDLYASAAHHAKQGGPMERIFASGMREYQKLRERRIADVNQLMDGTRRAMRASFQREMDEVESGLFAAIPAVTAYNRYAHQIDRVASQQETFIEEFSNILQRNVGASGSGSPSGH
jgi:biopolymer transport protein ExbB/TolQ